MQSGDVQAKVLNVKIFLYKKLYYSNDSEHKKTISNNHKSGFMNAASPGVISAFLPNKFYKNDDDYLENLSNLMKEEYEEIKSLNKLYKEKFKFPFIIAVKGLNRLDIIKSMKNRVKNNYQEEFSTAINEVHKIAKIRLDALEL